MIIHVVKEGDTLRSIADSYGVSEERIILENEIDPNRLAIGQTLVILTPGITYTIQEGDTLEGIAEMFQVTVLQLLRNNAYLSDRDYLYPGETIVISYEENKLQKIAINGYAYPFIDRDVLRKTLPFLTYLTIYSYEVSAEGDINEIEDDELIALARAYGVAPIMMLVANTTEPVEEAFVTHNVLKTPGLQEKFFNNLEAILNRKDYYGVNINVPYIAPDDRLLYVDFIKNFSELLRAKGYKVFISLSLNAFEVLTGVYYPGFEYEMLRDYVDYAVVISYDWGNVKFPNSIVSYNAYQRFLNYMVQIISAEKLLAGVSSLGHIWQLPYIPGESIGLVISYNTAIQIAYDSNVPIQYDDNTEVAYYQFIFKKDYIVRFRDARSVYAFLRLLRDTGFYGGGIWNIMTFLAPMWLVFNAQCEIVKVL